MWLTQGARNGGCSGTSTHAATKLKKLTMGWIAFARAAAQANIKKMQAI